MPNKQSAKKRMRQDERRRERNRSAKSTMKTAIKKASTDLTDAGKTREALSTIGKTAKRGIIHWKKAARLSSRLQRHANDAKASSPAS